VMLRSLRDLLTVGRPWAPRRASIPRWPC